MFFKDTGVLCVSHGFKHGRPPLPQLIFQSLQRRNCPQLPSSSLLPTHLGPCTDWSLHLHHLRITVSLLCTDSFPVSLSSPRREKNGLCDTWKQRGQFVEEQAAQRLPTGLGCRNMWVKLGFSLWDPPHFWRLLPKCTNLRASSGSFFLGLPKCCLPYLGSTKE